MAVFPAVYFTYATRYPQSGTRISLSNSYDFTAGPTAPDQRTFILKLSGMQYFGNLTSQVNRNMEVLEAFYNTHKLHVTFDLPHPIYGTVKVKFNRPLEIPEGIQGGNGVLDPFTVELIEQP